MPAAMIAMFWGVSMLFVLTPGADWAYAISSGLRHRSVAPAVGRLLSGHLVATVVVAAGVAALLVGSPTVLAALTAAGAAYLAWLGIGMLRHPASMQAPPNETAGPAWRQAVKGFGISGLNPKVFLLFLALLPQFVVATAIGPCCELRRRLHRRRNRCPPRAACPSSCSPLGQPDLRCDDDHHRGCADRRAASFSRHARVT
jgi:threonine/homoserine/homoserine lactone efflux protein